MQRRQTLLALWLAQETGIESAILFWVNCTPRAHALCNLHWLTPIAASHARRGATVNGHKLLWRSVLLLDVQLLLLTGSELVIGPRRI